MSLDTVTDEGSMLSPCYVTPLSQTTTQMNIPPTTSGKISTPETIITISAEASSSAAVVTGSVVGGIAVVLLVVIVILLVVLFVQQKKQKRYPGSGQSINNYPNNINGMSIMSVNKFVSLNQMHYCTQRVFQALCIYRVSQHHTELSQTMSRMGQHLTMMK